MSSSGKSRYLTAKEAGHLEVQQKGDRLWVLRPHLPWTEDSDALQKALLSSFCTERNIVSPVRWYYTPMALGFSADMPASATVYDCMDELSGFLNAPPQLLEREAELFATADVVFTGGLRLFEAKRDRHANIHAFPSSIDVAHFSSQIPG